MSSANSRTADHPIDPLFLERWSPRAFTGESMTRGELLTILEAARWAPSSYNIQPWRFVYALRDTAGWFAILDLLMPFNRAWALDAAVLVILLSDTLMKPPGTEAPVASRTHTLDAGAAAASFMLQATRMGWQAHGMTGFDIERTAVELGVPERFRVEAAYAIGRQADKSKLPPKLQEREFPSPRLPLDHLAFEGRFPEGSTGTGTRVVLASR